jgi:hypothetical protein
MKHSELTLFVYNIPMHIKAKVNPWHTYAGTDRRQRYSSNPFTNLKPEGSEWPLPCPSCFTPIEDPALIVQKAGWASGLTCMGTETLSPTRIRPPDCSAHSEPLYRLCYPKYQQCLYPSQLPKNRNYDTAENGIVQMETSKGLVWPAFTSALFTNGASMSASLPLSHYICISHLPDATHQNCVEHH